MRAVVVFESMFGNTQRIAEAIGQGLAAHGAVDVVEVGHADSPGQVDLVVAGGPTHAFGMSRPRTRQDAEQRAAGQVVSAGDGLREWIAGLPRTRRVAAATFDTKVDKARWLPGSARAAAKALRGHGYRLVAPAESFLVGDLEGPLLDGEVEQARRWGDRLGASLPEDVPHSQ